MATELMNSQQLWLPTQNQASKLGHIPQAKLTGLSGVSVYLFVLVWGEDIKGKGDILCLGEIDKYDQNRCFTCMKL